MSRVTCFFCVFFDKAVELVNGGSIINMAYPILFLIDLLFFSGQDEPGLRTKVELEIYLL